MVVANQNIAVAKEIYKQLGAGKFSAMTGAKNLVAIDCGLQFQLSSRMTANKCTHVTIKLNAMDTYDIEFIKVRAAKRTVISQHEGYYYDMLKPLFVKETGLNVSL